MNNSSQKQAWKDAGNERLWAVGELAAENDISTRTIRFYEEQGFLNPLRRGRTRFFRQKDRIRLKLVLRGKRLGFTLAEIREIVFMYDNTPGEIGQLEHFQTKIRERRAVLLEKQKDLETTLAELADVEQRCHKRMAELQNDDR
ncbi:MAG TPA: MerR family DNA-binding transcriptional regulator [Rhizobiales bacterium]|nr:MerR family DNA-binding transcriptional regulator [Hyphomicrobiales bacterium]